MNTPKLKTFFHNLWPKLLVITAGVSLFLLASELLKDDIKSLVIGIAGGLISIPLVFISYEVWQKKSQKKLNLSVYEFAERKVQTSIAAVKTKLELLMEGAFGYFEKGSILIDDADIENIRIKFHQQQHEDTEENFQNDDDLLSFEYASIFENLTDARYLEFQLSELSLAGELEHLQSLLANAFIMQRLEDEQVRAIIYLIETISQLVAFFNHHADVFCRTSINLHGFNIGVFSEQPAISALLFTENEAEEPALLDVKPAPQAAVKASPLPAYVINPDYYNILSDLIFDVINAINNWKSVFNPVFIDYENAQITVL